ncbi:MAG: hypothetical protein ABI543_01810 [Ignavibacteria bacterium]
MKNFNKTLNEDIALLRTLHANKDKREFNDLKAEIMRKHNISKATVYREMKKETPGEYRIPNYNPPKMDINTQEVLMVRELLLAGRQGTEIIKIMGRELGINYYWDRFDRARAIGEELSKEEYDPGRSYFPENGNMFMERLLGTEYMAHGTYKEYDVNGKKIKLSKETCDNIKILIMRDNPMEGEPPIQHLLIRDQLDHNEMCENLRRKISHIHRSGEIPSAYAIRSLQETKEKLEKRQRLLNKAKDVMLENRKKLEEEEELKEIALKKTTNFQKAKAKKKNITKPQKEEVKTEPAEIKSQPEFTMPDYDGKQFRGQTVRQRTRNGKLTGVTVIKKFH